MAEKIYIANGKEGKYGVNFSICLTDIAQKYKEHITEYKGKKYIRLNIQPKREVDQYGKTHAITIDTWKPNQQNKQTYTPSEPEVNPDELPF